MGFRNMKIYKHKVIQIIGSLITALYVLVPMGIVTSKKIYFFTTLPGSLLLWYGTWMEYKMEKHKKKDKN